MSDTTVNALIIAAGAFVGAVLGNIVQPFLAHTLRKWEENRKGTTDSARAQFDLLYRPLYDFFMNNIPSDEGIEGLVDKDERQFVDLVRAHRHLADPRLEQALLSIEDTWTTTFGTEVDYEALAQAYGHVGSKYNALRKRLHLPHEGLRWRFQRWWRSTGWRLERKWWKFRQWLASRSAKR